VLAELASRVGGVAQHLGPGRLVFYEEGGGFNIAGVAGAEIGGRDEPRLGLGSHVRLQCRVSRNAA
jgi:hypothetical protein